MEPTSVHPDKIVLVTEPTSVNPGAAQSKSLEEHSPDEVNDKESNPCCIPCICLYTEGSIDLSHVFTLRVIGSLTIIFAICEFGLGGGLFNYLDNVKTGAWWVGVITFCAGVCGAVSVNRDWVLAGFIISIASCITAVVGAALDGEASHKLRAITACASQFDSTSAIMFYGLPRDYSAANACLYSVNVIESDGCSCVTRNNECTDYYLSGWSKFYHQTCNGLIGNYSYTLAASTAFCVFCFIMALILAVVSGLVLFSPELMKFGSLTKKADSKDHIPAETAVNDEVPVKAVEVPDSEVEAKVGVSIIA